MNGIRVLFVEDDATLSRVLTKELAAQGMEVQPFLSAEGVLEALGSFRPQVALLDLKLPGTSGFELLASLRRADAHLQVVVLTGHGGVPEAVEAMRMGAHDFLIKPTPLEALEQALLRAAEKHQLLEENERLRRAASGREDRHEILGTSPAIEQLKELVARIAPTDAGVLIQGENGTGKELVARNLHHLSRRSGEPFVVLNCGAVPSELVESELFGHERGAFTGADRRRVGLFEAAHGGTLLLDEVGELPPAVQPALLRVLQFGEIRPVGSNRTRVVDARVLAATNRDLRREIQEGRFREDLFYRLATFHIQVPPLRSRREDIPLLARTFLARESARSGRGLALEDEAAAHLAHHDWPGNIRELENAMTRLSVLARGDTITAGDVEAVALAPAAQLRPDLPTLYLPELERLAVAAALDRHGGNKRAAAEELGISVRTLYYKLERSTPPDEPAG